MNVAFIKHAQNDVDGHDSGHDQPGFGGKGILKCGGRALKGGMNAGRYSDFLLRLLNGFGGVAQRHSRRKIERERHYRKLALVIDRQRRVGSVNLGKGRKRYLRSVD